MRTSTKFLLIFLAAQIRNFLAKEDVGNLRRRKNNIPEPSYGYESSNELVKACTIQLRENLYKNGTSVRKYDCELDPVDANGVEGILVQIKDWKNSLAGINIVPGRTTIFAEDSFFDSSTLALGPEKKIGVMVNTVRNLATTTGDKTVLVVLVNTNNGKKKVKYSEQRISDSVFSNNADGNGANRVSLKTQYAACSYNKLRIQPAVHEIVTNGAITINITEPASADDSTAVRNAATAKLTEAFGTNPKYIADHVMYCLPNSAMDRIAYGFLGGWLSVYQNKWCSYVSNQMHEIGHNLGLDHSNERGEYDDTSGAMGFSLDDDNTNICFNNAKNWQLGWYSDRHVTINPLVTGWTGDLIGVVDYGTSTPDQAVVVKIEGGDIDIDYYVGYNKATSFNSDSGEGRNQVTIQSRLTGKGLKDYELAFSELEGKLSAGDSYNIPGLATVVVDSITPEAATITIQGPAALPTKSPTSFSTAISTSGLCDDMTDDIYKDKVCTNTEQVCEALARLEVANLDDIEGRESCNDWCGKYGLVCETAWNNNGRSCDKTREISCKKKRQKRSICRCNLSVTS